MAFASTSTGGAGANNPGAVTMLEVQVQRVRNAMSRLFNQSDLMRVILVQNIAGIKTILDSKLLNTTNYGGWFSTVQALEVQDAYDGVTAALDMVKVYINSVLAATLSPTNSNVANTSGLDYSGAFTARTGLVFNGNSDATNKPCRSYGGRLVKQPGSGFQAPNVGRPDVVLFGENTVSSGVLGEDSLLTSSSQGTHDNTNLDTGQAGLLGPYVQCMTRVVTFEDETPTAITRRRVFCTDGLAADIKSHGLYDPIEHRFYEWNITAGGAATDLLGFQLVANHGPRVLIAAPASNRSLWALSAKADGGGVRYWQDFDPSASRSGVVEADRALVGTTAGYGLPADEIIALVEIVNDDASYETLFMCSRTIWSLRGDPGLGGGLTLVSSSTGILGPNAFCFDNKGNLYWLGNGGLFAMPKGTRIYTKRDGQRLPDYFELADVNLREISLRFRSSDNTILVFESPRDGSAAEDEPALIACYDIEAQEFTQDELPVTHGPSASLEITGRRPEERDVMVVGNDGFVRQFSDRAYSDDGEPIDWMVEFAPQEVNDGDQTGEAMLLALEAAIGSGPVDVLWYAGTSADEVVRRRIGTYGTDGTLTDQDTPDVSGAVFGTRAGRTANVLIKKAGGAHRCILRQRSADHTVVIERARASFKSLGMRRDGS